MEIYLDVLIGETSDDWVLPTSRRPMCTLRPLPCAWCSWGDSGVRTFRHEPAAGLHRVLAHCLGPDHLLRRVLRNGLVILWTHSNVHRQAILQRFATYVKNTVYQINEINWRKERNALKEKRDSQLEHSAN